MVVSLVGSLLTLLSMAKIWLGVFWGSDPNASASSTTISTATSTARAAGHRLMVGATVVAVAGTLTVAVLAGPLWNLSERAAADLVDPRVYIEQVIR